MKKLLIALIVLAAFSASGQKGPLDQLGFHADKLYDFSNTDSVNLFNGNLMISIPIGTRYAVSSTLSYQLGLVFNGKTWDDETWTCQGTGPGEPAFKECDKTYPNLRSNAGLGWRVSLGRLLPPYDAGLLDDSLTDIEWVYEGPAGDEHALGSSSTAYLQANTHDGLRMRRISATVREVEFGSGEVHRFELENQVWRLKQMRDRFNNAANVSYTYSSDGLHEQVWTITDTAGRSHTVEFVHYASMNDGWSRGQNVSRITMRGVGGVDNAYVFGYTDVYSGSYFGIVPMLTTLTLPDLTQYTFTGALDQIKYPTGGTVSYTYTNYAFASQSSICSSAASVGVSSRSIFDGTNTRTWQYVQQQGSLVPATFGDSYPCSAQNPEIPSAGPRYWSRTSVLTPPGTSGHRSRTDHYFSTFSDDIEDARQGFQVQNPLPGEGMEMYSHSGTIGAPALSLRKRLAVDYASDVDASDGSRLLATETFADCDSSGDCSNGTLLRTTYDRYAGAVYPNRPYGHPVDTARLTSSRTVYQDDTSCGGSTCYTDVTYSDDTGAGQFRTSAFTSNLPGAQTTQTTTQLASWPDPLDDSRPWILQTFTERAHTEGGITLREQFCFDPSNGALTRQRVLTGQSPAANDLLTAFDRDVNSNGDVTYVRSYGGDTQASLGTQADLCSAALPSEPAYKVHQTFTNGTLSSTQSMIPSTNALFPFKSLDLTVDSFTGLITESRDTAGLATSFGYNAVGRLTSVTPPGQAQTTYGYNSATSSTPATVNELTYVSATDAPAHEYQYDGLGRLHLERRKLADGTYASRSIDYDETGNQEAVSEWESAPAHFTTFTYDPFGRTTSVRTPDNNVASFAYRGISSRERTIRIFSGSGLTDTTAYEYYDQQNRLIGVREGGVNTAYDYDVAGHLITVCVNSSITSYLVPTTAGCIGQQRRFVYDGRGFLVNELHPENGVFTYSYDSAAHVTDRYRMDTSAFNLHFAYDRAGRLQTVSDAANLTLKSYAFDTAVHNGAGKLATATRHNRIAAGDYVVTEAFDYDDAGGRLTTKTTTITPPSGANEKTFSEKITYNSLGLVGQIEFPNTCVNCGGSGRATTNTYQNGSLIGIGTPGLSADYASLTQWPGGMTRQIAHGNGVIDTFNIDTATMMQRPSSITFGTFASCTAPSALGVSPVSPVYVAPGNTQQLFVMSSGTGPITYQWFDADVQLVVGAGASYTTPSITQPRHFFVRVSNACGRADSALVTVSPCAAPSIDAATPADKTIQINQSTTLTVSATGDSLTYQWYQSVNGAWSAVGSNLASYPTSQLTATTAYYVRVSNCGGSVNSRPVTVTVKPPLSGPAGLVATMGTTTQVNVVFNAVSGASYYVLERRSSGAFAPVTGATHLVSTAFSDTSVSPNTTYLFRVYAVDADGLQGSYSTSDLATTVSYTSISPGSVLRASHLTELLTAVNCARAAAGLSAVSWGANQVNVNATLFAVHINALRTAVNEARVALGFTAWTFTDAQLTNAPLKLVHVTDVRDAAK